MDRRIRKEVFGKAGEYSTRKRDACVMLKILQELAGVAEASRVLTVEFGEMWNGEFWRVEESWMEWKEFVECVFGLARVEYRFGKNTKGE